MLFYFIIPFIIFCFFVRDSIKYADFILEIIFEVFFIFISTILGVFVLGGIIAGTLGLAFDIKPVPHTPIQLTALNDVHTTEGSAFLGSGSIDGELYYYYVEQHDGYKTVGKIKADDVHIYEDGKNYLQQYDAEFVNWGWELIAAPIFKSFPSELHIPKNSITTEFNINLE